MIAYTKHAINLRKMVYLSLFSCSKTVMTPGIRLTDPPAATFFQVAQLCNIFSYTLTYGPEATASIVTSDPILHTQDIPSAASLPSIISTSATQTAPDLVGTGTATEPASTSNSSSTAGGSSGTPAAATSNAALRGAPSSRQGCLMLFLATWIGWMMSA